MTAGQPRYPLGDADLIAADTVANGYLTADPDGVTLARAYLDLKAQVSAVLRWIGDTGCTCPGEHFHASLPDHELDCPAQVEHLLTTVTAAPSERGE